MSEYAVEIYDEREFARDYSELLKQVEKKIGDRYEFAQCLQVDEGEDIEVTYHNIFNENESANFVFDDEYHLVDFEIEED